MQSRVNHPSMGLMYCLAPLAGRLSQAAQTAPRPDGLAPEILRKALSDMLKRKVADL